MYHAAHDETFDTETASPIILHDLPENTKCWLNYLLGDCDKLLYIRDE